MNLKLLVDSCTKCPELVSSRKQPVFGEGNPKARLLIIGEAPGREENEQGRPFVGDAGRLLNSILHACGWNREDIFISNTCRCRPPNNRTPTKQEVENCREHLDLLIDDINPEYILALGSVASQNLVGLPVSQARSVKDLRYRGKKVICTYHPSYILHQEGEEKIRSAKAAVWMDLAELREVFDGKKITREQTIS